MHKNFNEFQRLENCISLTEEVLTSQAQFELDLMTETVFRMNDGGIVGFEPMTKQDLDTLLGITNDQPGFPLLDDTFVLHLQQTFYLLPAEVTFRDIWLKNEFTDT